VAAQRRIDREIMAEFNMSSASARLNPPMPAGLVRLRGGALSALMAVPINVLVFIVGSIGEPILVNTEASTTPEKLGAGAPIFASLVWITVGIVGVTLFEKSSANGFRWWRRVVTVLCAMSIIPLFTLHVHANSKASLVVMHVVVAASAIAGQLISRHWAATVVGQAS
jgi:hypothetical protein